MVLATPERWRRQVDYGALLVAGGDVRELDFQFNVGNKKIGAPFHGLKAFFTTPQLSTFDKVGFLHLVAPCSLSIQHHCSSGLLSTNQKA